MTTCTVRDLIASGDLADATLLAGEAGIDRPVHTVDVTDLNTGEPRAGALVVIDIPTPDRIRASLHNIDYFIRCMSNTGAIALVVCQIDPDNLALAPKRIADRFRIPLLVVEHRNSADVASELKLWIRHDDIQAAHQQRSFVDALEPGAPLKTIVDTLAGAMDATVAVLSTDGSLIAGTRPAAKLDLDLGIPAPVAHTVGGGAYAAYPLRGTAGRPELWLIAHSQVGGVRWRGRALAVLKQAMPYVSEWLAHTTLTAERDARFRSRLLTEILELGEAITPNKAALAARCGWQLTGIHTGMHFLRLDGTGSDVTAPTDLRQALHRAGIAVGDLIDRSDGWVCWISAQRPRHHHETEAFAEAVTQALRTYNAKPGTLSVVAGIGTSVSGLPGLATTLGEAHRAALVAATSDIAGKVHRFDLRAAQILTSICSSPTVQELANTLLAPLNNVKNGAELLNTLTVFLANNGNTLATARQCNIARNTVPDRLHRIRELLGVDLDDPGQRLELHLACLAQRRLGEGSRNS